MPSMYSKCVVALALVATANAVCREGQKFDDQTGAPCIVSDSLGPHIRTERNADDESDIVFVVKDGAKVGMRVGDEDPMYFNDFQGDIKKVGEGNINAISLGVEIGKSFVNNFTKDLLSEAAKVPALEVQNNVNQQMSTLQVNMQFEMAKVTTACKIGEWETTPASGSGPNNFKPAVCQKVKNCQSTEYESQAPTLTSDRGCTSHKSCDKNSEYTLTAGTSVSNTVCRKLTTCGDKEEEIKAPTPTTDRVCRPKQLALCSTFAGQGNAKRTVVSLDPDNTKRATIDAFCLNDGTYLGGDGSSRLKAGKSCGTIRRLFKATTDKAYWVFMNDTSMPVQVYCDMNSCGNDAAVYNQRWGNRRNDFTRCGGWTMAFKWAGTDVCAGNGGGGSRDCYYYSRHNIRNLRFGEVHGSHTNINRENAMSHAYSRQSFSDVMMRSLSVGWRRPSDFTARKYQSLAWRHPWTATSLVEVAQGCRVRHDGELLLPSGMAADNGVRHRIMYGINWQSNSLHDHYMPENPRTRFGFFGHDGGGCANNRNVIGCPFEYSGHSRHFIGAHLGNNDPDRPGGSWSYRITSFGVGAGYCSGNSDQDRYAMTGHWWGHGRSNMQAKSSAVFVREKADMMI